MADINILKELNMKINLLESNIRDLKIVIDKEKSEMDDIGGHINNLKAKYEIKKLEVGQLNGRLDEKLKIVNEARKAYTKIVENTAKLIEAVDIENNDDGYKI